jgi:hypothetical protein
MGNTGSSIVPEISLVDETGHFVAVLQYSHCNIKISSTEHDVKRGIPGIPVIRHVTMSKIRDDMAIDTMMEHALAYLADNKIIYVVSNFLPSNDGYKRDDKEALINKLKRLLNYAVNVHTIHFSD